MITKTECNSNKKVFPDKKTRVILSLVTGFLLVSGVGDFFSYCYAQTPVDVNALADSIRQAEGVWTYGIKSIPCSSEKECRKICINSIRNNLRRYERSDKSLDFISFMGLRYCPPSIHPLNKNWVLNVKAIYKKRGGVL